MHERVMYADPSLATSDAAGNRLGDSIYAAFVLQEAVRLINSTSRGDDWSGSEALIIGLGTGIATTALKSHGIQTTIVEIDPAVYDAARTYFGLPDPGDGRIFFQDARGFVWHRKQKLEAGEDLPKYDVVIHDVFSGGGVPGHLFTSEFWDDLKGIVKEDGVVVVVCFWRIVRDRSSRAHASVTELCWGTGIQIFQGCILHPPSCIWSV